MVFLFVAQQDVASAWMAYLSSAAVALPTFFRMVGAFGKRGNGTTLGESGT
jgi:hypothetical protein